MASHNVTFIVLGLILLIIGLVLVDPLKSWSFVLMIIGVLVALKGIIPMLKKGDKGEKIGKEPDNVEEKEDPRETVEGPESEPDEADSDEANYKFCKECGKKISKEAEYCSNCGKMQER